MDFINDVIDSTQGYFGLLRIRTLKYLPRGSDFSIVIHQTERIGLASTSQNCKISQKIEDLNEKSCKIASISRLSHAWNTLLCLAFSLVLAA